MNADEVLRVAKGEVFGREQHRVLVIYEGAGLQGDLASYLVRFGSQVLRMTPENHDAAFAAVRAANRGLLVRVSPTRDRRRPYVFRVRGRVRWMCM